MNRRQAVKKVFLYGGAVSASSLMVIPYGCSTNGKGRKNGIDENAEEVISEIADLLIPDTDVPGAKAAGMGSFVVMMIQDCYPQEVQADFSKGLIRIDRISELKFGKTFLGILLDERKIIVEELSQEAERINSRQHFFALIRELTFLGYFTSEIGATKALNYLPIPGRYDGCIMATSDQRVWTV